ncbi:MAG: Ig-like domain-containing protein [Anaerolineae bacterium]|nr:Ig-like domain-containing protein [Anaerolineae bacterium]
MTRKITVPILMLSLLLMLACSFGSQKPTPTLGPTNTPRPTGTPLPTRPVVPYTPIPANMLAPVVLQRSPQRGESLSPDAPIEIVFDKPMNTGAVAKAFKLQIAGEDATVQGDLSWPDARTLRFKPAKELPRDTVYDVIITQDAVAESGEPLREPLTFRFATAGYLEVAQVIPNPDTADVETDATITVMFNRPVVPLTSLNQMEDFPEPLTFDPPVKGIGEWLNTSIYVFKPEAPLAGGVTYRATVAAGLTDVAGALLAEDYSWNFATAPPQVVWVRPNDGETQVGIDMPVTVEFNQPVSQASFKEFFRMEGAGLLSSGVTGEIAVNGSTVMFTPTTALDFNTTYSLRVNAGLTSVAGGQGMKESFTWSFKTVPLPEIVATDPANLEKNAQPQTAFQIRFNTSIDPDTVMPNLTMTPPLSPTQVYTYFSSYDNTFTLYFGAQPSTDYEVVIDDGIADPYGNTIPKGRTVSFRTGPLEPSYTLRTPDMVGTYDAALPLQVVVGYVNVTRLDLKLYTIPVNNISASYWSWRDVLPAGAELRREWRVNLESPLNKQEYIAIDLAEQANATFTPGVYFLKVSSPDISREYLRDQYHVLVVSNLNLTLKTGPKETFVWATDLSGGGPVAGLPLKVMDYDNRSLGSLTTDANGVARMELPENRGSLIVYSENPFAAVADGWGRGISPWEFGMGQGIPGEKYRTYIYTDRPIYRPGQTVHFKGVVRTEDDVAFAVPAIRDLTVYIRDAAYEEIYRETLPLSDAGTFDASLALGDGASLGTYFISVELPNYYFQQPFTVAAYRAPEFEVVVESDVTEVLRGTDVAATISARYFFGGPLANADVTWNVLAEGYTFTPPWGGRYSFDDVNDPYYCRRCWWWMPPQSASQPILSGSGTTDANGTLLVTLNGKELQEALETFDFEQATYADDLIAEEGAAASKFRASRITLEATATGPDNQAISGRASVVVHPGLYYIGLSPQQYVGEAGDESPIDLVAVDWAGNRLAGKALKVELYRREWINTFVENDFGGGHWTWETKETWEDTKIVTTNDRGEAVATFIPAQGGSYHIVAMPAEPTPETEAIRSSIFIWVAGKDIVSWRRENNDRITLISDKTSYKVGETAEILIPSPFEGSHYALVTAEREGVRRHEIVRLESNSAIYRLPILESDIPNIYVSVVLVKPRGAQGELADFKMGLLPLDVDVEPFTLAVQLETPLPQAQPGEEVSYTIRATRPNGEPLAGAELSLDMVDKAVLSLLPRSNDIVQGFYARRALQVNTGSVLSMSVNRYLKELAEDTEVKLAQAQSMDGGMVMYANKSEESAEGMLAPMEAPAAMPTAMDGMDRASNIAAPEGVEVREEFADTAFWSPRIVTDAQGQASVTIKLPDNLTTWTLRGVALNAQTFVGEGTSDLVATKPLLVRPVAPRFFVVDDRAQLAANVSNNTDSDLNVEVSLSAEGIGISTETPPLQTILVPAHSERKVTWWVTVDDVVGAQLIFGAVSGNYADASKPRLTTGPDGSLLVFRYTTPDIVGTAGQLVEGGATTEAVALPPDFDDRRGSLTVQLDPSLAAGMQDGLKYLEHYEYECAEQTVSRFLPNVLTYNALKSLGIQNPDLEANLPALIDKGLGKLYLQQNPDGGWGWWPRREGYDWYSSPYVSAYVVFAMLKVQQTGWTVKQDVLDAGLNYLQAQLVPVAEYKHYRNANRQAWLLYVLAEARRAPSGTLDELYENRDKLSTYARGYLAQSLWLYDKNDARLATLLSDFNNAAILSATGAHWEETNYDWWAMNTDTRSTAIVLDTLAKLDPGNALIPNVVRWLMVARKTGIWETTQETAWALIALTDWMVETGELDANYEFGLYLNDAERASGVATRETIRESVRQVIPITDLLADATNALSIARTDGPGRLYYTAHLEVFQPVEKVEPADRGIIVQRRYTLADCVNEQIAKGGSALDCPDVREVKLGDVIRVDLTIIAPHDRYYVVVEDPLPAGGEAIDTGLATTSLLAMDPQLQRTGSRYWWWWNWYSRSELRDEKVVLFSDVLAAGTYEYSYTFRATLPGDYHVMPTVAKEFYFPEVFGRSDGRLLTIGE